MSTEIQHSPDSLICACGACMGLRDLNVDITSASLDDLAGGTANGKPIWTEQEIAAYLNRSGGQYGTGPNDLLQRGGDPNVITFGFHENQQSLFDNGYVYARNGQLFAFSEYFQFGAFNTAQREATREAMNYWDDVIAVDFVETSAYQGDINFGNLTNSPNTQAYSRIPTASYAPGGGTANFYGNQIAGLAGDVWVSTAQASNFQFDEGLYGLNTLTHEIGHSLGLSHPGNYNFGPGFAVNYINGAEYAQDARNYSIMSYWNPRDMGATATGVVTRDFDWSLMSLAYGGTPMVHDILAAQNMYGVETNTRTGNTTYGFNSTADRDAFDFEKTPWPTMAIWDAGGNDTLDASGYNVNQTIDLTPGSLSSIGGVTYAEALEKLTFAQVNANRAAAGYPPVSLATYNANMVALAAQPDFRGRLTDNVGIAYGAVIENAVGGGGNDVLVANSARNVMTGNAGFDTVSYRNATSGIKAGLEGGQDGDAKEDKYISIEAIEGSNFADILDGNNRDDSFFGLGGNDLIKGGNGDDTLGGGDGDDFIEGGNDRDTIDGGNGNDVLDGGNHDDVVKGGAGNDRISGGNHSDTLGGGDGTDTLDGGNENDILNGGSGSDRLTGGNGRDVFAFSDIDGTDVITDFKSGHDTIDLTAFDLTSGDVLISDNKLFADVTGDGLFDLQIVIEGDRLTLTDIVFV